MDFDDPEPDFVPPKEGEPPLHRAARIGDHDAIRRLAAEGADLNALFDMELNPHLQPCPQTPLMVAAGSSYGATAETVDLLLSLGADPGVLSEKKSAVVFACLGLGWCYEPGGDVERLRALLDAGCPFPEHPSARNHLVCRVASMGRADILGELLERGLGANPYWRAEEARERERAFQEMLERYKENDDDLPFQFGSDEMRESYLRFKHDVDEKAFEQACSAPHYDDIPFFCAVGSGSLDCVNLLLSAGADPHARDNVKRSAMYYASDASVIALLVSVGIPLEDEDVYEWSTLVDAVMDGESALPRIKTLVEAGADVNGTHDRGFTVFMAAACAMERSAEVLRYLVEVGADPHAVTDLGFNAFHAAIDVNGEANAEESVREIFSYLKELGVDIEHKNQRGETPLARAIDDGTGVEVRVLCELGANPNAVCPKRTCSREECEVLELPLLFHAARGSGVHSDQKTEALLRAGADPLAVDEHGFTALELLVAGLCHESSAYDVAYEVFFAGLDLLDLQICATDLTKEDYVERVYSMLHRYVEGFAAGIPVPTYCDFDEEWRVQTINSIAMLCAYEARERLRTTMR